MKRPMISIFPLYIIVSGLLLANPTVVRAQAVCPLDSLRPIQVKSLESLKRVPVLNQGRIKPFESYAQNFLLLLSGKKHYGKEDATEWMARFLFAPRSTYEDKVFLINSPEIAEALKIEPQKNRRYSYRQIDPGYNKLRELAEVIDRIDDKNRSVTDREILRVYSNLTLYSRLSGAFEFAIPHPDFTFAAEETFARLHLPAKQPYYSFLDIMEHQDALALMVKELSKKAESEWSATDKDTAKIVNILSFWMNNYANCPLGIIPSQDKENEVWLCPMDAILEGFIDPVYHGEIIDLRNMSMHYWNGSQLEFDTATRSFTNAIVKQLSFKEQEVVGRIPLELLYNKFNLFLWSKLFYGLGFILFLFSLVAEKKWMYKLTFLSTLLAFIPHVFALVLRVMIMARPPVSNLFETFIFVGAVCAGLGLILELVNKNWLGLVVANTGGLILTLIAGKFSAEGDTMQMLVAVLNSNFWLSTHVIAITTGYAGCCVAGIMGHIYILQALSQPYNEPRLEVTYKNMLGILGFGLTMSFLGTALGGIWADQSWGRFWGWDPKENGALMIVLWCAIIFHAKIAKLINPLGVAVGCVLALMVVMWAWFGVNLLSVGLHSYGFTSGIANSLLAYVIGEFLFIAISLMILGKRNIKI